MGMGQHFGVPGTFGGRRSPAPIRRGGPLIFFIILAMVVLFSRFRKQVGPVPGSPATSPGGAPTAVAQPVELPKPDLRLCTAVVILIDTSGSMGESVSDRGDQQRPKHVIAREALARIVDYTAQWQQQHTDRVLNLAICRFSDSVSPVLPGADFDAQPARDAVQRIPGPGGGTAIGLALQEGFKALYASGCVRKYVICITDGENTVGPAPSGIAQQLYAQTGGEVELHFVAFDTSAAQFDFLKKVNGFVVAAAGGEQLRQRLTEIYEKRILAESMAEEAP